MESSKFTIIQNDKYNTTLYSFYTPASEPLGSVVILHGTAEHHGRYQDFINYLNENGYDAYIFDYRGHGPETKFEELGHFADRNGHKLVIGDAINVLRFVHENNRGRKLILFGHSLGAILAQNIIQYYDDIDGCILAGTSYLPPVKAFCGRLVARFVRKFRGAHHYSPFLAKLTMGYEDFSEISDRTAFDWLTRDNAIVGRYINDPFCGYTCTAAFYYDLIKLNSLACAPARIKHTRRELPILFASGSHDPVGNYGHGVSTLFSIYQKLGFNESECIIYDEARHELLNEINRDEIMSDFLEWMNSISC